MIFTRLQSNILNTEEEYFNELSESIINILRFFFNETIIEVQKKKKKKTIIYKEEHIQKEYYIKTYLEELPIYKYQYKNTNDALSELIEIGFNSFFGLQTIFNKDNPTKEEDLSHIDYLRGLVNLKNLLQLTKEEYKTLLFFIDKNPIKQIN